MPPSVRLDTDLGAIRIELAPDAAPRTVANFLRYVDEGRYANGRFHRSVRLDNQLRSDVTIEVIQGGMWRGSERATQDAEFPAIPLERTSETGLRHVDGAVSMARDEADTATSEFFICVGDQPSLDHGGARHPDGQGFAVFGRVVDGMDVVLRIHRSNTRHESSEVSVGSTATTEQLEPPVKILGASRG